MNNRGYLLIEVMVALGISMVAMLGMLSMAQFGARAERNVASLSDYSNLVDEIKMYISNPNLCPQMIGNVNNHTLKLNGPVIGVNSVLTSGSQITQVDISLVAATTNPNEYSSFVVISGVKNPSALGPRPLRQVSVPVTLTLDAAQNVVACGLASSALPVTAPIANSSPTPTPTPIDMLPLPDPSPSSDPMTQCLQAGGVWAQRGKSSNFHCQM